MAVRYVVRKRKVGFGTQKVEKYVAQNFITNNMNFKEQNRYGAQRCSEVCARCVD